MADRLEMLRIFCAAAQAPSFRAAATRLGLSPQAVTRAVQALEAQQGEVLFLRSTRHVQLTAAGEALAVQARECLAAVDALFERPTPQDDGRLAGRVRVAAPVLPGRAWPCRHCCNWRPNIRTSAWNCS
jgi:DNA-binding transcriptional LysR family regulator